VLQDDAGEPHAVDHAGVEVVPPQDARGCHGFLLVVRVGGAGIAGKGGGIRLINSQKSRPFSIYAL
jgi:hypothetical protein